MPSRNDLRGIARRAMIQRGLLPDFSPAVLAETNAITEAGLRDGPFHPRSARPPLGLDRQRRLARSRSALGRGAAGGRSGEDPRRGRRRRRARVKDGSAIDGHARTNTTSVYTAAEVFPMLPEKLSTDLTSLGEGQERLAVVMEMAVGADGTVGRVRRVSRGRPESREARLRRASPPGSTAAAPAPPPLAAVPGLDEQLRIQDRAAQAMKGLRHERRRAEPGDARGPSGVRRRRAGRPASEREEPGQGADRGLHDRRERRDRAVPRSRGLPVAAARPAHRPSAGTGSSSWPRIWASACHRSPTPRALEEFLAKRRRADPARFPDLSLSVVKLLGSGEYVVELPGRRAGRALRPRRAATTRTPRRRTGDIPDLVTQRLLKAALAGRPAAVRRRAS